MLVAYFTVVATVGAVLLAMPTGRLADAGIGSGDRLVAQAGYPARVAASPRDRTRS